ncbi:hypothetical protein TcCL_Unassigned07432, partial [Trypanosoma cruzi]
DHCLRGTMAYSFAPFVFPLEFVFPSSHTDLPGILVVLIISLKRAPAGFHGLTSSGGRGMGGFLGGSGLLMLYTVVKPFGLSSKHPPLFTAALNGFCERGLLERVDVVYGAMGSAMYCTSPALPIVRPT